MKKTLKKYKNNNIKNNKTINKTKKKIGINKNKVYNDSDFKSKDGMLTSVWGPSLWHYLHTMSFNYPVKPTETEKNIINSLFYH